MSRKSYLFAVAVLLILTGIGILIFNSARQREIESALRDAYSNVRAIPHSGAGAVENTRNQPELAATPSETPGSGIAVMRISMLAGTESYSISVASGLTVYDAMSVLASSTPNFDFKSRYFPGLGYFIEQINGHSNGGGYYWTLYINGKYSEVGASGYELKDKDKVEWKYEKGKF